MYRNRAIISHSWWVATPLIFQAKNYHLIYFYVEIKEPKINFSNSGFSLWWPEYGCWNFIIFQIRKSKMAYLKRTPFFSSPAKNKNLEKQMDPCIGVSTLSSLPTNMTITPTRYLYLFGTKCENAWRSWAMHKYSTLKPLK